MGILSSSSCQLGLGVWLSCLRLSQYISTIKYKGSQVADGRKEVGEVDRVVCGALQGQGNCLNQCYRIRTT